MEKQSNGFARLPSGAMPSPSPVLAICIIRAWSLFRTTLLPMYGIILLGAQGDEKAHEYRERIAEKMTAAQIAEAQSRAREWKPKQTD